MHPEQDQQEENRRVASWPERRSARYGTILILSVVRSTPDSLVTRGK